MPNLSKPFIETSEGDDLTGRRLFCVGRAGLLSAANLLSTGRRFSHDQRFRDDARSQRREHG